MPDSYQILVQKLDEFIRKYYKNLLIRGAIYSLASIFIFYILIVILEYLGHFGVIIRSLLFYLFIITNTAILVLFFIKPLLKLYRIGKIISHEQAAQIIGAHFGEVKDKLLNTLQLKQMADLNKENSNLIEAGINQKIALLQPIPFHIAIDFKKNKKYLKFVFIPFLMLVFFITASPTLLTAPTNRLLHHATFFEREAPFQFVILNKSLRAVQQEDFLLEVKITGDEVPENIFIESEGIEYQLNKENTVLFQYVFKNIQKNTKFKLKAEPFYSKEYEIIVLPMPMVIDFDMYLTYPSYIQKKEEKISNTGDLVIPEGTQIKWEFRTKDAEEIRISFPEKKINIKSESENQFIYTSILNNSQQYSIIPLNRFMENKDSLSYSIQVIPDAYPTIKIHEFSDTVDFEKQYFKGMIKDDYGFSKLTFNYRIHETASDSGRIVMKTISMNPALSQQEFYYMTDFNEISNEPGTEISYYFEIWDNDAIHGSKVTRSQQMIYKVPSLEEIENKTTESNEQIKNELTESITQAKKLQKEIEKLNKNLTDKKTLSWQEKKQLQEVLESRKALQDKIALIQKENETKSSLEGKYKEENEALLKKQEELNKLFNELMTDEMKELFKKIEEMLDKLDKNKVNEILDKMKLSTKDLEKQLDRNLELFKQLEFEKKMNDMINKLDKLSEKQEKLSEKTQEAKTDKNEALKKEQDELSNDFQEIRKELDSLNKINEALENPNKLENTDTEEKNIEQEMQNSSNSLNENKNKKAAQSQKNAAAKMKELSQKYEEMQKEMEKEKMGEDINTLREILENLVKASFDQEEIMNHVSETKVTDPKYVDLIKDQKKLMEDVQMIEDSLTALSKRQIQIESFVNMEISKINDNMTKAMEFLNARTPSSGKIKQQAAMSSINTLALMLSETLSDMQQQMMSNKSGIGSCSKPGSNQKPGSGKPSFKSLKEMQEMLNKQLEGLKNGKDPNGESGQKSMSEQLAKLAAQQEAIRKQLQELADELKKEGNPNTGSLNALQKEMEKTESDLVNKIINNETIKRQKDILTRLLESEKAEKERDLSEKRESNEAKNENFSNPSLFLEYKSIKIKEVELLKTVPPSLKYFYKNKVNEYFCTFEE